MSAQERPPSRDTGPRAGALRLPSFEASGFRDGGGRGTRGRSTHLRRARQHGGRHRHPGLGKTSSYRATGARSRAPAAGAPEHRHYQSSSPPLFTATPRTFSAARHLVCDVAFWRRTWLTNPKANNMSAQTENRKSRLLTSSLWTETPLSWCFIGPEPPRLLGNVVPTAPTMKWGIDATSRSQVELPS